jgi:hypothetical protein
MDPQAVTSRCTGAGRRIVLGILTLTLLAGAGLVMHQDRGSALAGKPSPVAALGRPADTTGCQSAPLEIGRGTALFCADHSAVIVDDTVQVVSLYGPDSPVIGSYEGALPGGVRWGAPLIEVAGALGKPKRITDIYGPPTLVYSYTGLPYGSLEFQFDARDELVRINATVTH